MRPRARQARPAPSRRSRPTPRRGPWRWWRSSCWPWWHGRSASTAASGSTRSIRWCGRFGRRYRTSSRSSGATIITRCTQCSPTSAARCSASRHGRCASRRCCSASRRFRCCIASGCSLRGSVRRCWRRCSCRSTTTTSGSPRTRVATARLPSSRWSRCGRSCAASRPGARATSSGTRSPRHSARTRTSPRSSWWWGMPSRSPCTCWRPGAHATRARCGAAESLPSCSRRR